MAFVLERIQTEGIVSFRICLATIAKESPPSLIQAQTSINTSNLRPAAVAITKIFETHVHADFVSGARELRENQSGVRILEADFQLDISNQTEREN